VAALGSAAFGSEKAIEVQNILLEHGDNIVQERANVTRLGGLGAEMKDLIFCYCSTMVVVVLGASDILVVCEREIKKRDKCGGD
jgi:hypothetical protein